MHLNQKDSQQSGRFRSSHSLFYDLPDSRTILMLSGLVDIDQRAPGWSSETANAAPYLLELELEIALPPELLQDQQHFIIEQSLPFVGLGSLSGTANVLWGIKSFCIDTTKPVTESVLLRTEAEVARSGEVLKTLSYGITLLGQRH